jgi:hypothetical protein
MQVPGLKLSCTGLLVASSCGEDETLDECGTKLSKYEQALKRYYESKLRCCYEHLSGLTANNSQEKMHVLHNQGLLFPGQLLKRRCNVPIQSLMWNDLQVLVGLPEDECAYESPSKFMHFIVQLSVSRYKQDIQDFLDAQ